MKIEVTTEHKEIEAEKVKEIILADDELTKIAILPLYYTMAEDIDFKKVSYLFYVSMLADIKDKPQQYEKLKEEFKTKADSNYLKRLIMAYINMERTTAFIVLKSVILSLYEINLIKDKKLKENKLRQLREYIENRELQKIIDDILFVAGNTGYMISLNAEPYTDDLKTRIQNVVFLEQIANDYIDFTNYLLEDDDTTTAKYMAEYGHSRSTNEILRGNKYTNYNLFTADGKDNYIKRHDDVEAKLKKVAKKTNALKEYLQDARQLVQDGEEVRKRAETITYNDFIKLIAYDDIERAILTRTDADGLAGLEVLRPKATTTNTIFNDKPTNALFKINNDELTPITKLTGDKLPNAEELKILVANADIEYERPLEPFDIEILEAIKDIFEAGNVLFDVTMVKNQILKRSIKRERNSTFEKEIKESIEKMRKTDMTLDITKQIAKTFKTQLTDEEIKKLAERNYILPLAVTEVNKGRRKKRSIPLYTEALLLHLHGRTRANNDAT